VPTGVYLSPVNAGYLAAKASRAARKPGLPFVCRPAGTEPGPAIDDPRGGLVPKTVGAEAT
jgi:hypothetical protein